MIDFFIATDEAFMQTMAAAPRGALCAAVSAQKLTAASAARNEMAAARQGARMIGIEMLEKLLHIRTICFSWSLKFDQWW